METIIIRRAESGDYEALCQILDGVDRLHRDRLPHIFRAPEGPARSREYVEGLLQDGQTLVLLAQVAGRPAGCLVAFLRPRPPVPVLVPGLVLTISDLAVEPAYQRQGVGRALMAEAEAWGVAQGADSLELNVYEFNEGAIAFYRALGYETLMRRMVRELAVKRKT